MAEKQATQAHARPILCRQGDKPVTLQARTAEDVTALGFRIVNAATNEGADLIVMGSHGHWPGASHMLGSVATKVLAESPVPVLIVR